jgi:hypothetical protein
MSSSSLARGALFACALVWAGCLSACSHIEYVRGEQTSTLRHKDYPDEAAGFDGLDFSTQELQLYDRTGGVCASLNTTLAQAGARQTAINEAIRERRTTAKYSWRVSQPAEFRGMECGIYNKWGSGRGYRYYPVSYPDGINGPYEVDDVYNDLKISMWEGGLHLGGAEPLFDDVPWALFSISTRFGAGLFRLGTKNTRAYDNDPYFTLPVHLGLVLVPEWLFGFQAKVFGGADPIGWLFTEDRAKVSEQLDYGGQAGYVLSWDAVSISAWAGWQQRHHYWGDYWVDYQQWTGSVALDLFWEEIF